MSQALRRACALMLEPGAVNSGAWIMAASSGQPRPVVVAQLWAEAYHQPPSKVTLPPEE
ncbi:hypothetical protein D3C87_2044360 [compost metagenome]